MTPDARGLARVTVTLAAVMAALLASGCATIPSSGPVQGTPAPPPSLEGAGAGGERVIVGGPQPGWSPEQVVEGFLAASAAGNLAVARQYLTPGENKLWRPGHEVIIVSNRPVARPTGRQFTASGRASVLVQVEQLAKLNSSGQYFPAGRGGTARIFTLQSARGRYLIASLPSPTGAKVSRELMLSNDLFHVYFRPRNLYYYGSSTTGVLVPDPVFVPTESANPAAALIGDLFDDPNGWLQNAAATAFPPGARLRKLQELPGDTAIVDIGLPPGTPRFSVPRMAAQLVTTLTSPSYSPALFRTVKLKINGQPWPPRSSGLQDASSYWRDVPHWRRNAAVYYLTDSGARALGRLALHGVKVPGQAGTGQLPLSQIALSPSGKYLAGIAGPATTVYTQALAAPARGGQATVDRRLHARLTGSSFTSLSWDNSDDLWVAGRRNHTAGLWVLPPRGDPVRVRLPANLGPVTGLRMAPDGVRIAMIAGHGRWARLLLTAVIRQGGGIWIENTLPLAPGLARPTALTWYDEDNLLVVSRSGSATRLAEVPANGNGASSIWHQAGIVSITAAGRENPLYMSMATGKVEKSVGLNQLWNDITPGRAATYPG